ncbi:calpain family cysteine protease domain-containing protein [Ditylenchus destructor]|uniref:Calpain family cysteine protease domain-containing protein n=1 Tax=Ditylenchus destructor TaxID=166010 RepID=A0AAD4N2S4_9BILA|nr:calpain family cysteine protease domain-containing protein [Ditylenchus destructor]
MSSSDDNDYQQEENDEYGDGEADYYDEEQDQGNYVDQGNQEGYEEEYEDQPEGDYPPDEQEQYHPGYHNQEAEPEEVPVMAQQQYDAGGEVHPPLSFDGLFKGALDGFGGGTMGDIVGTIGKITGGQGGISNMLASGGLEGLASGLIANAAHQFLGVNPETGKIIGAIAGNIIFNLGGKDNSLSNIGKIVLDNLISGKYHRKVDPFVSPTLPSFNLDFHAEREKCLRERRLFEDPEFPPVDRSLYYSNPPKMRIEWKRPSVIILLLFLLHEFYCRFDVVQGALGDCWLLAAAANLTLRDELFYRVVPPDQSFTENYAGIFHFQFWRYGKWVDVVIDDLLPTHNGKLVYMHSPESNSFWSALLEKAYAKLYGSYEALKGGSTAEALEDFSGGLIEYFDLHEAPKEQLLALLVRGFQMGSLFGCSIDADPQETEARLDNGLVRGHAYSITALQTVNGPHGETVLLRIRNPWGNEQEWNGAWGDGSSEWNYVTADQKHAMNLSFNADGEFWMSFDDFLREFQRMENCNLGPEVLDEIHQMTGLSETPKSAWTNFMADGSWQRALGTAGGCRNHIETFPHNPQFSTTITINGSHSSVEQDGKVTVICAVLQKYRRELRVRGLDTLPIGFVVYPVNRAEIGYGTKLNGNFFEHAKTAAKSPSFVDLREVTARFRVPPGSYVIVPSTFEPNEEAEFLLRVFSSGQIQAMTLQ